MFVKAAVFRKRFKVHPQTLRRWADEGKIAYKRTPGGIRLYQLPAGADGCGSGGTEPEEQPQKKSVVYARVSSAKQKDDLQRQADHLLSKFPDHQLVTDVGSGINWKRKGLLSLLDAAHKGDLQEIVVAARDRLCRFAFDLLQHVFAQRGVRLVVLDSRDMSPEQELSDDLLSIVQIFCCRRNAKRRYPTVNTAAATVAATGDQDGDQDEEDQAEPHENAKGDPQPVRKRRQVHL